MVVHDEENGNTMCVWFGELFKKLGKGLRGYEVRDTRKTINQTGVIIASKLCMIR